MAEGPSYRPTRWTDPSLSLPPGALPPPLVFWPKRGVREWWRRHGSVIESLAVVLFVLTAIWVINNLPLVPVTDRYHIAIVPAPIIGTVNYFGEGAIPGNGSQGDTLSGTFACHGGAIPTFILLYGDREFQSNNSSGSFHLSSSVPYASGTVLVYAFSAATVYVNVTVSFTATMFYSPPNTG
jgi:hypothetical protein